MKPRTVVITAWPDASALPDLTPGEEYMCVTESRKFFVLRGILVQGPSLIGLQVGDVFDIPFELESVVDEVRRYLPKGLDHAIREKLIKTGAALVGPNAIAISPGLEVRLQLLNEGAEPTKPRAALLVEEEIS